MLSVHKARSTVYVITVLLTCWQEEYTGTSEQAGSDGDVKFQYNVNQPLTSVSHSAHFHTTLPRPVHSGTELSSSLPYGLNSPPRPTHRMQQQQQQRAGRLLQHSHSLPSSPHKLQSHVPVQSPLCSANIYHTGSFTDVSYNMTERTTTTNRSKVLPKEVRPFCLKRAKWPK